jgi:hypothetical protein
MGEIRAHLPVLGFLAAFSRHNEALAWARATAAAAWGPVELESPQMAFEETRFYESTMGPGLRKVLLAFERLIDPAELVPRKHQTNAWEEQYAREGHHAELRPLNLDPGYLSEAKLVLASTKDRDHRIYLDQGIYAEGTLYYRKGRWQHRPWTYPDYQRSDYHQFLAQCRDYLRARYHGLTPPDTRG